MSGTQRVRYMGVTLTRRLRLGDHVEEICERAKRAFFKVARLNGSGWGLTGDELLVIYRGVFLGILLYGVLAMWPVLSPRSILESKLGSAQRSTVLAGVTQLLLLHCQGAADCCGRAQGRWGRGGCLDQD
ncbi:unnamed protein product [Nesidiocoris tenuis]|uniref:Uncharacterized protein n=1 Tax=Nesidiocoris tenuis TaxID=355587 RepID=A0A6H5GVS2_9HEMI|nr:unnamed protein product [Nesidiocoris tenuis]